jgi:hypothetical protein
MKRESGFALLMVMVMLAVGFLILGATMARTTTGSRLNDRNNHMVTCQAAAEAATEKVMAQMAMDFQMGAEGRVLNNFSTYFTNVPTTSENPFWANFEFTDAQGHTNRTHVSRTSVATNPVFTALSESYQGLSGFCSNYRIISNVRPLNSLYNDLYGTVQQDVQVAEIPIFQFAIFYNSLLEFTWAAPLVVRGRTHCNSNIFVGSSSDLTFSQTVTCTGVITNPAWDGKAQSSYGGAINYNGQPAPGFTAGYNTLSLPIGTNNTPDAVREIINLPPGGEDPNSALGQQRYYNKAGMVIIVTNTSPTNVVVYLTMKNSPTDAVPFQYTNYSAGWSNNNFAMWLSTGTNVVFNDQREGQNMKVTQIDVGNLRTWIATNASVASKFVGGNPLNIIYIADLRSRNATTNTAVRLVNGLTLPTNGLTIATLNPIYIQGNYNCPNAAYLGTTNTSASVPSSVVADALTILSSAWNDSTSMSGTYSSRNWTPPNTTINTAIISGMVYSTGPGATEFCGGVVNQPRLLENWNGQTLTLNTSIVNLYNSVRVTSQFQNPGNYYNAPSRNFNFDTSFTLPTRLPPGTPRIRKLIRATYCNPPPLNITYAPQPNDYVPF